MRQRQSSKFNLKKNSKRIIYSSYKKVYLIILRSQLSHYFQTEMIKVFSEIEISKKKVFSAVLNTDFVKIILTENVSF